MLRFPAALIVGRNSPVVRAPCFQESCAGRVDSWKIFRLKSRLDSIAQGLVIARSQYNGRVTCVKLSLIS